MGIKATASKYLAEYIVGENRKWASHAVAVQLQVLKSLVHKARNTAFGREHGFDDIQSPEEFRKQVPRRDYEALRPYINRIIEGEKNVLWKDLPLYFAKTSGTTSGAKYIPITRASIPHHIKAARNALLHYIHESGNTRFVEGKMIFLSGSPELSTTGGILTGRLSGIVNHHVPTYLRRNQVPSYSTNCIEQWEDKVEAIVDETLHQDMTLISGIPPWVQTYFDRLLVRGKAKNIRELFPNFSLMVHGGVNYEPYKSKLEETIGTKIDSIETFPASEGFFAFQDSQYEPGLLLNVNSGMFYEFIPLDEIHHENPQRLHLGEIELNKNYAMVINSNAGLWGYNLGDTVKFISRDPYKLLVTGRIKHFISAFGEHVIAEEVESALTEAAIEEGAVISEFTVAPEVNPRDGLPRHEWYIEFKTPPGDIPRFSEKLDRKMCSRNIYYDDLIRGGILQKLVVRMVRPNGFVDYSKSIGKLGGQNKLPRLSNNREFVSALDAYVER